MIVESLLGRLLLGWAFGAGLIALGVYEIRKGQSFTEGGSIDRKYSPFAFWMGPISVIACGLFVIGYGAWWYWWG
jgi:hypothetical protein